MVISAHTHTHSTVQRFLHDTYRSTVDYVITGRRGFADLLPFSCTFSITVCSQQAFRTKLSFTVFIGHDLETCRVLRSALPSPVFCCVQLSHSRA